MMTILACTVAIVLTVKMNNKNVSKGVAVGAEYTAIKSDGNVTEEQLSVSEETVNDLPDVYGEIIPSQMQYISKLQNSILDLAINFFAPTYAKEVSNEEITDSDIVKNDSFPELDSVFGKEEMTTNIKKSKKCKINCW